MGMDVSYIAEGEGLRITVDGNLDLTLTRQMLGACALVDERLLTCVIDCRGVHQVFDSGRALLMLLTDRLARFEVRLIVLGDFPGADLRQPPAVFQGVGYNTTQARPLRPS